MELTIREVSGMFGQEKITSFGEVRLRLSGMRMTEVYEILCRGGEAELSQYWLSYENHEDNYNLSKRAVIPADDVLDILNECGVIRWDGFCGNNPPGVRDGIMFDFTATVNGDRKLRASGSNNFPRHYREFIAALDQLLTQTE